MAGNNGAASAVIAGYSESCAKQQAYRLERDADVLRIWERAGWSRDAAKAKAVVEPVVVAKPEPVRFTAPPEQQADKYDDPLKFFRHVMNNCGEDPKLRLEAAKALAMYTKQKPGEAGKKEQKNKEAEKVAGGRFSPAKPPLSIVKKADA